MIVVIGDTHFGSSFHLGKEDPKKKVNSRLVDYYKTFNFIIDAAIERKVKYAILTGDLFRDNRPTNDQINYFAKSLIRLRDNNIKVIIIPGNHDQKLSTKTYHVASIFKTMGIDNITVADNIEDTIEIVSDSGKLLANVIPLPFINPHMLGLPYKEALDLVKNNFVSEVKRLDKKHIPIISIGHFLVEGVQRFGMELTGHEKELCLPVDMFRGVDITLMGHVHNFQQISKEPNIYFLGSMERIDFGEKDETKYAAFINVGELHGLSLDYLELPTRNLHHIEIDTSSFNKVDPIQAQFAKILDTYKLKDSIVKITISATEEIAPFIDTDSIREILSNQGIHHCVGIYIIKIKTDLHAMKETITDEDAIRHLASDIEDEKLKELVIKNALTIKNKCDVAEQDKT